MSSPASDSSTLSTAASESSDRPVGRQDAGRNHRSERSESRQMHRRIKHRHVEGDECKKCSKCKVFKPVSHFAQNRRTWDSLTKHCKLCLRVQYWCQKAKRDNWRSIIKNIHMFDVQNAPAIHQEFIKNLKQLHGNQIGSSSNSQRLAAADM